MLRPAHLSALLVLILLLFSVAEAEARSAWGKIESAPSGDTLTFRGEGLDWAVKLYGVATPQGNEAFAFEARRLAQQLVVGKNVRLRVKKLTKPGEVSAIVLVDGLDLGLEMLRAGLGIRLPGSHYRAPEGELDDLVKAELEGRAKGLGLWQNAQTARPKVDEGIATSEELLGASGNVDRNVSKKSGHDNECAITQNPVDTNQLFLSCNVEASALFAARSLDGGATWTYPDPADKTIADGDAGQGGAACCDPTLAWDRFGNLYVTYINDALNRIVTLRSADSGLTFTEIGSFGADVDQPTIVAANVGANAAVWVVWTEGSSIVARGALATGLGTIGAFSAQQTAAGSSGCVFGDIAILPSGAVIQVCQTQSGESASNIRMNLDGDGLGAGVFGAISTITSTNVGSFDSIPAQNSRTVDAEVGIAVDALPTSPHFGRLYLVYGEEPVNESHDHNIMVRWSDNDGSTWSAPIQINDDATTRSQFLPKIAADPESGSVAVCWHDCRNSGTNTAMELFCSTATNAGASPIFSTNAILSDGASTSNGSAIVEFGDYMGLVFRGGRIHPAWADTSNSTADNPDGTSTFDAYSDFILAGSSSIFADGFESGDTSAWDFISP